MNSILAKVIRRLTRELPAEAQLEIGLNLVNQSAKEIPLNQIGQIITDLEKLQLSIEDYERISTTPKGKVKNWDNEKDGVFLEYYIMNPTAPWTKITPKKYDIPGMITGEEVCYYNYIPNFYTGWGEIIELGPWLGHSTMHLAKTFSKNPSFSGKKIHVFDDFVWRSKWMNGLYHGSDQPNNYEDFRFIFERFVAEVKDHLEIHQGKFVNYDGNEKLPMINWEDKPIEMIIVDCGRTIEANSAWFNIFSKNFVANKTIIVMQDWRLHRERPRKFFNQTLYFTNRYPHLELLHEVGDGGIATFIYREPK
jgi:hypothetical protein